MDVSVERPGGPLALAPQEYHTRMDRRHRDWEAQLVRGESVHVPAFVRGQLFADLSGRHPHGEVLLRLRPRR